MYLLDNCQEQANLFYTVLLEAVEKHAPKQRLSFKNNDKPWIDTKFKDLIASRNHEFQSGRNCEYKRLRNRINRLRKHLQKKYFNQRIKNLKASDNSRWWKEVKGLCGLSQFTGSSFLNLTYGDKLVDENDLPAVFNNFIRPIVSDVAPLSNDMVESLKNELSEQNPTVVITEFEVYSVINQLKRCKASMTDAISNSLLISLADVLAAPIASLINSSIRTGCVPAQWKMSRLTLVPKVRPAIKIESDFRPIAISCPIASLADRIVARHFNDHFSFYQDSNQFGVTSERSAVLALIKLCHILFNESDNCVNVIRILFVDFSKAFDLINHNTLSD